MHSAGSRPGSLVWRQRRSRNIALLLFAGSMLVFLAVSPHKYIAYDAASMVGVAHDLVNHFSLQASHGFDDYLGLSTPYSPYGIGLSLVIAPFYALSKLTGHEMTVLSLINPLITSCTVVVAFAIGWALRWSESMSVLAAVTYGIVTMALQATTELFSEPAVSLCIALMIWGILRWRDQYWYGPLVVGLSAAAAAQFRSDSVFTVWIGLLALPLFVPWRSILRPAHLASLGIPLGLSLAALGAYNYVRWHSVLEFSYNGQGFHTPIGRGVEGLLFSPGKSFFVFNPIAVLGVVGLVILLTFNRAVGVLFILLIVPRVVFFAKWDQWPGGVDWGPRFLLPVVLLFVLSAVEVLHRTPARTITGVLTRVGFVSLFVLSLGISYVSVRIPYDQWLGTLENPKLAAHFEQGGPLFPHSGGTDAMLNAYDFTFRASQIRGDLDLIEAGTAVMAPADFNGDSSVLGWLLLSLGCVVLVTAGVEAAGVDRALRQVPEEP